MVIISLQQGFLTHAQSLDEDGVEQSVANVNCAVGTREVHDKPERV